MWLVSNKVTVMDSGLLEGFRDCHCHLLPGVDDGVQEVEETIGILNKWEAIGVKEVWLTPHIMEDMPNEPEDLRTRFKELELRLSEEGIHIKIHLAAEHMMDGLFLKRMGSDMLMPLCASEDESYGGGRLLVETSYYIPPMNMENIIESIKKKGYEPILAHPERYQYMGQRDYKQWKQRGVLLQLNLPSLVGAYGPEAKSKAEWMLKEDMYDYCGSDTHSINQVDLFLESEISKKVVKMVKRLI